MFFEDSPPLSRGSLDRDARTRVSPELILKAWQDPQARVLLVHKGTIAVEPLDGKLLQRTPDGRDLDAGVFLGRVSGAPVFAVYMDDVFDGFDGEWVHPFTLFPKLSDTEREAVTVALALGNWHDNAGFSPSTGGVTHSVQAGWARTGSDSTEHFPRTDPAVIVLVEHDDRILLGSNVLWESGRFSLLAGFVEAGESAEAAVVREVQEEAGVEVTDVRFVASQPWPFPRSLMLGFHARLSDPNQATQLVPDPEEISELRWFSREQLREQGTGVRLPQQFSIAGWMIERWIESGNTR